MSETSVIPYLFILSFCSWVLRVRYPDTHIHAHTHACTHMHACVHTCTSLSWAAYVISPPPFPAAQPATCKGDVIGAGNQHLVQIGWGLVH